MRWAGLLLFPAGMLILAATGYADGEAVVGTIAVIGAVGWILLILRRTGGAAALLGVSGGIGLFLLFTGSGFYPILAGEVLAILGLEAGMSRREISPFPKEHQDKFSRRMLLLLGSAGIGSGGLAVLAVNLHLTLRFLPALGISLAVLAGLALLLRRVK